MNTTIIIGINSDIGTGLAERFLEDGDKVVGTFRTNKSKVDCEQYECDLSRPKDIKNNSIRCSFDRLLFCVGKPTPLWNYTLGDEVWDISFDLNGPAQLRLFRELYDLRNTGASVAFLSAGGVNSCPTEFSAYTLGKTFLVKACELIAAEEPDLNIFTYGPGWVRTKTHLEMLAALDPNSPRYQKIKDYYDVEEGSLEGDLDDIYKDLQLLFSNPFGRVSGRNFARGDNCLNPKYQEWNALSGYKLRICK